MEQFELSERESRAGCRVVAVKGELDLAVAGQLDELLARVGGESTQVLIDLGGCEFIDSSGIAVILRARTRLAEAGKRLAVCSPGAQVKRILSMTGLSTNDLVFESEAEALDATAGEA